MAHLKEKPWTFRKKEVQTSPQNGRDGGHDDEHPPGMDLKASEGEVDLCWDNHPGKGTAQQGPKHPVHREDTQIRATILVADHLRHVGEYHWKRSPNTANKEG